MDYNHAARESLFRGYPTRVIGNGGRDILEQRGTEYVLIGHTLDHISELEQALNQALELAETYHRQLVDAGLIEVPKTAEEALRDQLEAQKDVNEKLLQSIESLKSEVRESKSSDNGELLKIVEELSVKVSGLEKSKKEEPKYVASSEDSDGDREVYKPPARTKGGGGTKKVQPK